MPTPSVDRPEAEMERRKRSIKNLVFLTIGGYFPIFLQLVI